MAYSHTRYAAHRHLPRNHHGGKRKNNDTSMLLSLCLLAFLALSGFVAFKMLPTFEFRIGTLFSAHPPYNQDSITLGEIQLGATMNSLRNAHPGATKRIAASGAVTLSFSNNHTQYTVWYGKDGAKTVAFKARQSRTIVGVSEDDFVGDIATHYGAPSLAACSRRLTDGMRDCHFSWWVPGGIRLDLNSRQFSNVPTSTLRTTMQITNTRMEDLMRRTGQHAQRRPAY